MRKKTLGFIAFFLSLSIYFSCIDEGVDVSGGYQNAPETELLAYAKKLVGENGEGCSLIDLQKGNPNSRAVTDYSTVATPLWEKAKTERHGDEEVLIVPLQSDEEIHSSMYFEEEHKDRLYKTKTFSRLVIRKKNGETYSQVFTYLPSRHYAKNRQEVLDTMGFSPLAVKYYGTILISGLDGKFQQGFFYERGVPTIHFTPKKHTHTHVSRSVADTTECDNHEHSHSIKVRLNLSGKPTVASRSYNEGDEVELPCMFCGESALTCSCLIVDGNYVYCDGCNLLKKDCICEFACFVCGKLNCICEICQYCYSCPCICGAPEKKCDYCGNADCKGECQESDSGGNASGTDEPEEKASKAKSIFRNSNMTEANWLIIERMLDKIIDDCLGQNLFYGLKNFLNGGTLTIQFQNVGVNGGKFGRINGAYGIVLDQRMESNQLLHEMMHAYRAYNETCDSYNNSELNGELEAFYAQYLYLSRRDEFKNSYFENRYNKRNILGYIKRLEDVIDYKGILRDGIENADVVEYVDSAVFALRHSSKYNSYTFDASRTGIENFSNLRTLTINCE